MRPASADCANSAPRGSHGRPRRDKTGNARSRGVVTIGADYRRNENSDPSVRREGRAARRAVRLGATCGRLNLGVSDAHPPALAAAQRAGMSITVVAGEDTRHLQRAVHAQAQMGGVTERSTARGGWPCRQWHRRDACMDGRRRQSAMSEQHWMMQISVPASSRCVPKRWRSV